MKSKQLECKAGEKRGIDSKVNYIRGLLFSNHNLWRVLYGSVRMNQSVWHPGFYSCQD